MRVFTATPSYARRKCYVCKNTIRVGQTIAYERNTAAHRGCLVHFIRASYQAMPLQADEMPGHPLFVESTEAATQRAFDEYRAKLAAE